MLVFNYNSLRAQKARFRQRFENGHFKPIILAIVIVLALTGGALYLLGVSICWFVLSLIGPLMALLYWVEHGLNHLPIVGTTVDGLVSDHVLSHLPREFTVATLANAVSRADSSTFIFMRLCLPLDFIQQVASQVSPDALEDIWRYAIEVKEATGLKSITSGAFVIAIVKAMPGYEKFLAERKLSLDDLIEVIRWREQLHYQQMRAENARLSGGLARDWSFGYTPLLERFGRNISNEIAAQGGRTMSLQLPSRVAVAQKMVSLLTSGAHRNVCLVSPDGAGKTSCVHDFAEIILNAGPGVPSELHYNQVIMLEPASLLAAAPGRGELEELLNNIFYEASNARNIIICLDNAELFMNEEGQGSIDITNLILPVIVNNTVRIILTMNDQILLELERKNPTLVSSLDRINVAPSDYRETLAAMEDRVIQLEHSYGVLYTFQALTTAWRLSERYVHNESQPGASFQLLKSAGEYAENGFITAKSIETGIAETLGIKVGVAEDEDEKEKLLNMESHIRSRVIGQQMAVKAVSDSLRRARAGVRNQSRPIGAFLFLGPTGVGKTELAKALAEVYYGGEDKLVRVDMNQFTTIENVADLTADPADNPTSLTAQVMKKPFSVVLLDEIEKAHPSVLAALLQVLDEGVLRDSKSREVDFRDSILICTSNAGADKIREHIAAGEALEQFKDQIVNGLIDKREFLPEFLNRFDEIVVFAPLTPEELREIVSLIMKGINKNLEPQKITVSLTPEAIDKITKLGYDPRLGARPLRRMIQKTVENLVATKVISGVSSSGDAINIGVDDISV